MNTRRGKTLELQFGLRGIVDDAGDDDGGGAILEDIDLFRQPRVVDADIVEQILDGPGDAVTLGLTGDDHRIVGFQQMHEFTAFGREGPAVRRQLDFRAEDRIVLGEGLIALDMKMGLTVAHHAVKKDRLLQRADQGVADAALHGMVGPDRQVVFAAHPQLA